MYVIEPHGNAVYADAPLPFVPTAMVLDQNQAYPSTDREQLLAFDAGGERGDGRRSVGTRSRGGCPASSPAS